jgi:hypothetical protein
MLMCVAVAMLAFHPARAQPQVQVIETWPAGDAITLGNGQNFYLHLHYTSDQPLQIWARPYFEGKPAKVGSNPSRVYPAGSGDALGWFFLFDPGTQVDEVRISAGDGSYNHTPVVATYAVSITGGDQTAQDTSQPAWVTSLRAADDQASQAAYDKQMSTATSAGSIALFGGFMLTMIAIGLLSLAWPAWGLWRWRGGWRLVAAIPAAIMAFVVLRIVIGTARDPTSHNLWPFEIVMWGGFSCGCMLLLGLAHKLFAAKRA